jgi:hypothetical protein
MAGASKESTVVAERPVMGVFNNRTHTAPSEVRFCCRRGRKKPTVELGRNIIRNCRPRQAAAFFPSWPKQKTGGAMDVLGWLRNLGLEQCEAIFRDNDIDAALLSSLTNEDLKEIGVASFCHRRKLLEAIALPRGGEARTEAIVAGHEAERRQLTLMFCDLVGSTTLASRSPASMRCMRLATKPRSHLETGARYGFLLASLA